MRPRSRTRTPRDLTLFGYEQGSEAEAPLKLEEVSIAADPATLRRMAEFLVHAAGEIEKYGSKFGHEHFEDFDGDPRRKPRFVVVGPFKARKR